MVCRVVVLLASVVCPLVDEAVKESCGGFLMGGVGSCVLVCRSGSFLSGGQGCAQEDF